MKDYKKMVRDYRHGKTVTRDKWGVSVTTGDGRPTLHTYRFTKTGRLIKGEGYGKKFDTSDDAWAYALERGYIQPWHSSLKEGGRRSARKRARKTSHARTK